MSDQVEITSSMAESSRFTTHGREFAVESSFSEPNAAIIVGLYEDGRLIFSEAHPATENYLDEENAESLREAAETLRAQVEEMYSFLGEIEGRPESRICVLLAGLFASRGIYDEATRLYTSGQELNPANDRAFYGDGLALLEIGQYAEACERFSQAVSLKPLYADYRNNYGLALVWAGRIAEGRKQLDQALELNTYFADAYYNYGLTYLFNGIKGIDREMGSDFINQARALFEKAALIDPAINAKEYQTGLRLLDQGSAHDAFGAFKRNRDWVIRERSPSYEDRRADFMGHLKSSDKQVVDASIESLTRQMDQNPGFVDLSYKLAIAYLKRSLCDWRAGIEHFRSTLERNPDFAKAVKAYDIAYIALNDLERSVGKIERLDDSPRRRPSKT
ncbi:MAG: tetratricopeptide repeat protein [Candidatus Zixiibacteriota bacterium]